MDKPEAGTIGWHDLTVPNAEQVRDFYETVVGLTSSPVSMGDYSDFTMLSPGAKAPVGGICHARGANASMPAQWMLYFIVENLERSIEACRAGGGQLVTEPRKAGDGTFCVIRDPAGAVCGLYQYAS